MDTVSLVLSYAAVLAIYQYVAHALDWTRWSMVTVRKPCNTKC